MARAGRAGRAADAGDQARGRGRSGDALPARGLRAAPPRRGALERRGDRQPGGHQRPGHELRGWPGPGQPVPRARDLAEEDFDPFDEARMVSAVCGGIRVVSLYAPNGRVVGSPFYQGKLRWFERLAAWAAATLPADTPLVLGGDLNVTPTDIDVWDPVPAHGGTHVSAPERAALARLETLGLVDAYRRYEPRRRPLLVVGLPRGDVPPQRGHAHRPAVRDSGRRGARGVGGDRPRGTQGSAHPV